ncbi:hypothetical protein [Flagellimonas sp. 2504JD4-2]
MKKNLTALLLGLPFLLVGQVTNSFPDDGNVGIGTTTATEKLEVRTSSATHAIFKGSFSGIQGIQIERESGDNIRLVTNYSGYGGGLESSSKIRFAVNGNNINSPAMVLSESGNIGIGTTSPIDKLDIRDGGLRVSDGNDRMYLKVDNANSKSIIAFGDDLSDRLDLYFDYWSGTSGDFAVMSLLASGRVGIGTTAPDSKLAVKGKIHAEEVKVDLSVPGPDYVFEEDYDLKPLEEVQNYIKAHGHLPNIPSAMEMEANGIQLGAMNMKLLEKIEELTLYILKQEKKLERMEGLEQEIESLKQLITEHIKIKAAR